MPSLFIKMKRLRLTFKHCKWILKCFWENKSLSEEQRRWRNESGAKLLTHLTTSRLHDKFESARRVQDVNKECSGRSFMSTGGKSAKKVVTGFHIIPCKVSKAVFT